MSLILKVSYMKINNSISKVQKSSRCLFLLLTERNTVNQSGHNKCEIPDKTKVYCYGVLCHFQQYFSYRDVKKVLFLFVCFCLVFVWFVFVLLCFFFLFIFFFYLLIFFFCLFVCLFVWFFLFVFLGGLLCIFWSEYCLTPCQQLFRCIR